MIGIAAIVVGSTFLSIVVAYSVWVAVRSSLFAGDIEAIRSTLRVVTAERDLSTVPAFKRLDDVLTQMIDEPWRVSPGLLVSARSINEVAHKEIDALTSEQWSVYGPLVSAAHHRIMHFIFREQLVGGILSLIFTAMSSRQAVKQYTQSFKETLLGLFGSDNGQKSGRQYGREPLRC